MGIRALAAADLVAIVEDDVTGFGWPLTLTDPDGNSAELVGQSSDIANVFDPNTGVMVSGRSATVALVIASITAAGMDMPRGIAESDSAPWLVSLDDINGNAHTFKISETMPDRALGLILCKLEVYEAAE